MKNLFIIMFILLNFHSYGSELPQATLEHPSHPILEATRQNVNHTLREWENDMNANARNAYNNMTQTQKSILALMVQNKQYTINDRYIKYFWRPTAKLSDIIENLAILGTVVLPSATILFNENDKLSQILSCSCGVATLIFKGIRGYAERKVTEVMNLKLCLTFLRLNDAGQS